MQTFRSFGISASGLTAERLRMDTIANNLANANTTHTDSGDPYRRQVPIFAEMLASRSGPNAVGQGVKVAAIVEDDRPFRLVFDPSHPDAMADGYVRMPNIEVVHEMVDLITATRSYEANIKALNAAKAMAQKALEIGRG